MTLLERYPNGFKSEAEALATLRGKEFKVCKGDPTKKKSNHGCPVDTVMKVVSIVWATRKDWYMTAQNALIPQNGNYTIYSHELSANKESIQDLEEEIAKLDEGIKKINDEKELLVNSISFMKEHKLEKYDERLFKALNVLTKLGKKVTDVQRAQALAEYIK